MRRPLAAPLIAAAGVVLLIFSSMAASYVLAAVASQSRHPEAMMDYMLPAFGSAAEYWALPIALFGVVVCVGFVVLYRRPLRTAAAVLGGLAISVVGTLVVAIATMAWVGLGVERGGSLRAMSQLLGASADTAGQLALVATPIVLVGVLLLRSWHPARGLTEGQDAL